MSRDGSGVYHRPVGTDAVTDTTIESTKYNVNVADVEQDLNLPRPIVAGGTGATTPAAALLALSGETAKQVVTNYDSQIWLPGSFYSATTALGTLPVAAHALAGTAYYANATDFVLNAVDLTDPGNATYRRVMTSGVWGPWTLTSAGGSSAATSVGEYTFSTAITFPPAVGEIRFNNATQNSTTEVFLSHLTSGADLTHMIPFTIRNGSELNVQDKVDATKWKVFAVTADPVLSGGDYRFTVTLKNSANDLLPQRVLVGAAPGGAVRYDIAQTLTATQKAQARANIDVLKKNYIINGAMMVSQENLAAAGTATGYYAADQFFSVLSGTSGVISFKQIVSQTPAGSPNRVQVTVTTADAAVATGDLVVVEQNLEGLRVSDFKIGTANAKTFILQFGVKAPAGTYCVAFRNGIVPPNRSYIGEYTITAGEANRDIIKSIVVPGDVIGTWVIDNTVALQITWALMTGTSFHAVPSTWVTSNSLGTANQLNFMGTPGNIFELFDVGLYESDVAPPFLVPDYASELLVCNRYFELLSIPVMQAGFVGTPISVFMYKTLKRVQPTLTTTTLPAYFNSASGASINAINAAGVGLVWSSGATNSYLSNWVVSVNARI